MSDFMGVSAVQCRYSCSNYIFNAYHSSQKSGWHPIRKELFRLPYNERPPFPSSLVLGVSVLHLTIMSPVSESWHMSSLARTNFMIPLSALFLFLCRTRDLCCGRGELSANQKTVFPISSNDGARRVTCEMSVLSSPLFCGPQCCI